MKRFFLLLTVFAFAVLPAFGGHVTTYPVQKQYYQNQYDVQQLLLIGIPVQAFGLDYYYSVGDELREERIAERAAEKVRQEQKMPKPEPAPEPDFDIIKGGSVSLDADVLRVFKNNCATCHKPGKALGNIQLLRADGSLFVNPDAKKEAQRRKSVYESISEGRMPKNGDSLPEADIDLIHKWKRLAEVAK